MKRVKNTRPCVTEPMPMPPTFTGVPRAEEVYAANHDYVIALVAWCERNGEPVPDEPLYVIPREYR